ncbi:MAG: energy transducer TonB, partial [Sandaracinaceae bacterium]
ISMPMVARREHLEGTVIVRIRLDQDGRVLGARLSRSSGHDVLDEAAVASIAALSTVPAPPSDIPWDPDEELPLPVRYQVR